MIVDELINMCALQVSDSDFKEFDKGKWLMCLNAASQDARNSGWLRHIDDDTSITIAASTYTYTVPDDFAYIYELRMEDTQNGTSAYTRQIPFLHWNIHTQTNPVFFFNTITSLEVGKHIMVVGQGRPTIYTDLNQTVDAGFESFLRERTVAYACQILGGGISELSKWRQVLAGMKMNSSEVFLRRHPQEFRVMPGSVVVPGRE